jgi:hypothetical protein
MKRKFLSLSLSSLISVIGFFGVSLVAPSLAVAAVNPNCTSNGPDPSLGTDFVTYSIPTSGTYTIWSRLMTATASNNSYYLQVDCGAPISVGGSTLPVNTWTWVNYRDANTSSDVRVSLSAGSHTFNLTGQDPSVMIDRVVFTTDTSCIPSGTGDNCAIPATASPTPTPSPTVAPSPSPTSLPSPSPSPVGIVGDVNHDGHVSIIDLSLLLGQWGKAYPAGDFNHDGTISIVDLSLLLGHWTG